MLRATYIWSVLVACLLTCPSAARAETVDLSDEQRKYLELVSPRIVITSPYETPRTGSGVVIANRAWCEGEKKESVWISYILTAKHVVSEDVVQTQEHEVVQPFLFAFGNSYRFLHALTREYIAPENASPLRKGREIRVICPLFSGTTRTDYKEAPATIVKMWDGADLALIAVSSKEKPFFAETVQFSVEELSLKTTLYVCGSPHGIQGTISRGLYVPGEFTYDANVDGKRVEKTTTRMLSTCKTRPGGSGSAFFLLDEKGEMRVVGLVTHMLYQDENAFGLQSREIIDLASSEGLGDMFQLNDTSKTSPEPEAPTVATVE